MNGLWLLFCLSILLAPAPPGIRINTQTGECGLYTAGDEWTNFELPAEWQKHYPRDGVITTDAGSCTWKGDWDTATEDCCRELGYMYVPGNIGRERGRIVLTRFAVILRLLQLASCILPLLVAALVVFLVRARRKRHSVSRTDADPQADMGSNREDGEVSSE